MLIGEKERGNGIGKSATSFSINFKILFSMVGFLTQVDLRPNKQ